MLLNVSHLGRGALTALADSRHNCEDYCSRFHGAAISDEASPKPCRTKEQTADTVKPRTLAEKLQAAGEKVKAQDAAASGGRQEKEKPAKRDERS
jgi:hypothetical protein